MEPITAGIVAVVVAIISFGPAWITARRGKKAAETASDRAERAESASLNSKDEILLSLLGLHTKLDSSDTRLLAFERDLESMRSQISQMNLMVLRNRNDLRRLENRS